MRRPNMRQGRIKLLQLCLASRTARRSSTSPTRSSKSLTVARIITSMPAPFAALLPDQVFDPFEPRGLRDYAVLNFDQDLQYDIGRLSHDENIT
jgi:hypothetical protein